MCGRYFLFELQAFVDAATKLAPPPVFEPSYNIAPSHHIPIFPNTEDRAGILAKWGLVPFWSKEPKVKYPTINARSETAHEKPSYRESLKKRRCLVPASGFYEWMKVDSGKQPYAIQMESREPFAFAGLWEVWHRGQEDELVTCTIMTTQPNPLVSRIHNRMPVVIHPDNYDEWLDPAEKTNDQLKHLFASFPAEEMMAYPVTRDVGSPANNHPGLIEPIQL
ncbi:MAG: SOS response-associated peptidase [Chloroflexi bacterium]|nr:MAG: SOS response-associated peptidase [Chloroflexota bacterium]